MKKKKSLTLAAAASTALAASLISVPSLAEINQECLFTGEVTQNASDSPLQIRFTSIDHGENARCLSKRRGSRSKVQFKASDDIQALPEGSEVLYRYQELKDGDTTWELLSAKTPV